METAIFYVIQAIFGLSTLGATLLCGLFGAAYRENPKGPFSSSSSPHR